jgi:hypothetical protein
MRSDSLAVIYGLLAFLMLHVGYLYADAAIENAFLAMMWLFFGGAVGAYVERSRR